MSLHSIKSAKELLSREQGKSRNITLHFLGGEWIYNPLNEEESEKRKETEVGKYSARKIPTKPKTPRKTPKSKTFYHLYLWINIKQIRNQKQ